MRQRLRLVGDDFAPAALGCATGQPRAPWRRAHVGMAGVPGHATHTHTTQRTVQRIDGMAPTLEPRGAPCRKAHDTRRFARRPAEQGHSDWARCVRRAQKGKSAQRPNIALSTEFNILQLPARTRPDGAAIGARLLVRPRKQRACPAIWGPAPGRRGSHSYWTALIRSACHPHPFPPGGLFRPVRRPPSRHPFQAPRFRLADRRRTGHARLPAHWRALSPLPDARPPLHP